MYDDLNNDIVDQFIREVMEIELKPLYERNVQSTARQEDIIKIIGQILEENINLMEE